MSDRRATTKAKRAKAFREEQKACVLQLQELIRAVQSGDMFRVFQSREAVAGSMKYLEANDPRREK